MSGGHPFSADRSGTERCLRMSTDIKKELPWWRLQAFKTADAFILLVKPVSSIGIEIYIIKLTIWKDDRH